MQIQVLRMTMMFHDIAMADKLRMMGFPQATAMMHDEESRIEVNPCVDISARCATPCRRGTCKDKCGKPMDCVNTSFEPNMSLTETFDIKNIPFPHPKSFDEQEKKLEAMERGATPNIFQGPAKGPANQPPIDNFLGMIGQDLSTGFNRLLKGENVFTGDPIFGTARPQEIAP